MRELLELLEHDGRRSIKELATMLGRSEYEIEEQMKKLEKEKIILGYNTMIDCGNGKGSLWEAVRGVYQKQRVQIEHSRLFQVPFYVLRY